MPFYEPGLPELLRSHVRVGRAAVHDVDARGRDVRRTCTSSASAPRRSQGEYAADLPFVDAAFTELRRRTCDRVRSSSASRPCRSAPPRGWRAQARGGRRRPGVEPGVPARGLRGRGHAAPGPHRARAPTAHGRARSSRSAYAPILATGTPVVVTDFATAELVKVAANSFLATKISFINAMAEVCEVTGADVTQLAEAIGHDARIGHKFLHAGLGFGGGCLPKDIRAFMARAGELGVDQAVTFLKNVDEINLRRRARMVDLAREMCDGIAGRAAGRRARRGVQAEQRRHPRLAGPRRRARHPAGRRRGAGLRPAGDGQRRRTPTRRSPTPRPRSRPAADADVVLHLTEWAEFRDAAAGRPRLRSCGERNILDGRNVLDPDRVAQRPGGSSARSAGPDSS